MNLLNVTAEIEDYKWAVRNEILLNLLRKFGARINTLFHFKGVNPTESAAVVSTIGQTMVSIKVPGALVFFKINIIKCPGAKA